MGFFKKLVPQRGGTWQSVRGTRSGIQSYESWNSPCYSRQISTSLSLLRRYIPLMLHVQVSTKYLPKLFWLILHVFISSQENGNTKLSHALCMKVHFQDNSLVIRIIFISTMLWNPLSNTFSPQPKQKPPWKEQVLVEILETRPCLKSSSIKCQILSSMHCFISY